MYRINYGNGQVSGTFATLASIKREFANDARLNTYHEYAFVQRYEAGTADDPGDWFSYSL